MLQHCAGAAADVAAESANTRLGNIKLLRLSDRSSTEDSCRGMFAKRAVSA